MEKKIIKILNYIKLRTKLNYEYQKRKVQIKTKKLIRKIKFKIEKITGYKWDNLLNEFSIAVLLLSVTKLLFYLFFFKTNFYINISLLLIYFILSLKYEIKERFKKYILTPLLASSLGYHYYRWNMYGDENGLITEWFTLIMDGPYRDNYLRLCRDKIYVPIIYFTLNYINRPFYNFLIFIRLFSLLNPIKFIFLYNVILFNLLLNNYLLINLIIVFLLNISKQIITYSDKNQSYLLNTLQILYKYEGWHFMLINTINIKIVGLWAIRNLEHNADSYLEKNSVYNLCDKSIYRSIEYIEERIETLKIKKEKLNIQDKKIIKSTLEVPFSVIFLSTNFFKEIPYMQNNSFLFGLKNHGALVSTREENDRIIITFYTFFSNKDEKVRIHRHPESILPNINNKDYATNISKIGYSINLPKSELKKINLQIELAENWFKNHNIKLYQHYLSQINTKISDSIEIDITQISSVTQKTFIKNTINIQTALEDQLDKNDIENYYFICSLNLDNRVLNAINYYLNNTLDKITDPDIKNEMKNELKIVKNEIMEIELNKLREASYSLIKNPSFENRDKKTKIDAKIDKLKEKIKEEEKLDIFLKDMEAITSSEIAPHIAKLNLIDNEKEINKILTKRNMNDLD